MMRFDWYQATIPEAPAVIVQELLNRYGAGYGVEEGRGLHGYKQRINLCAPCGDVAASVLCGGNRGAHPNAWASGDDTDAFVEAIRCTWPDSHEVTRMDAAEDFKAGNAYELLRRAVRSVARGAKVKCREILPDEDPDEGRTYYAGSPTSDVRVRLYDKGLQVRAKLSAVRAAEVPRDWTRLEVQIRPKGEARRIAARVEAIDAWGFSSWTRAVAVSALGVDVPRVVIRPWRESDDERAYRFMLKQYGGLLGRMMPDYGTWAALGAQIGHDLGELARGER